MVDSRGTIMQSLVRQRKRCWIDARRLLSALQGYDLIDLRANGRQGVSFSVSALRAAMTCWPFTPEHAVPTLAFSATIKDMKALLHNA
jgi:hypothetical protein